MSFEYNDEIVVLDCGLCSRRGVFVITCRARVTYLRERRENVRLLHSPPRGPLGGLPTSCPTRAPVYASTLRAGGLLGGKIRSTAQ